MDREPAEPRTSPRPRKTLPWILGGVLVVIAVLVALQGIMRGTGEAVGVEEAAPGDDNASAAP